MSDSLPKQKLPNLIIAGVVKGGTTSVFTYLSRHPDICASKIKETNYFMPIRYADHLAPLETYLKHFSHCSLSSKYILESSPRYIYGGRNVPRAMSGQLEKPKIMFLLRDPTQRLFSYYNHMKNDAVVPDNVSFTEYAERALSDFETVKQKMNVKDIDVFEENVYVRGLVQGLYINHLQHWYNSFGDIIKIYFFEFLRSDPRILMTDICSWLEIDASIYHSADFSIENKSVSFRNKRLHSWASRINMKFEPFFRTYHPLKKMIRNIYFLLNTSARKKEEFPDWLRNKLDLLYEPYNSQLYSLLSSKGYNHFPDWLSKHKSQDSLTV